MRRLPEELRPGDIALPVLALAVGPRLGVVAAVEARDPVAAGLFGSQVAEQGVRRRPAHAVHAQLRHAIALRRQRKLSKRQRRGMSGNRHI